MKDFTEYPEALVDKQSFSHIFGDSLNITTRAISLTYNNETIEVYE
jgi:hypothetical protein